MQGWGLLLTGLNPGAQPGAAEFTEWQGHSMSSSEACSPYNRQVFRRNFRLPDPA